MFIKRTHILNQAFSCMLFKYVWSFTLYKKCPYSELACFAFSTFELNMEKYGVSLRIQSEWGKMWTKITPNMDTFHAVVLSGLYLLRCKTSAMKLFCKRKVSNYLRKALPIMFFKDLNYPSISMRTVIFSKQYIWGKYRNCTYFLLWKFCGNAQ